MTRRTNIKLRSARQTARRACLLLWVLLGLACGAGSAIAQGKAPPDYEVKAAFLVNFAKYVEWPDEAFASTNSPIVIASFGESKLTEAVRKLVHGRSSSGHPIVFEVMAESDKAENYHVVFIPDDLRRRTPKILEKFQGKAVLTVGESERFLDDGGVINFVLRDRKVRLDINLDAAKAARLKISSKLLGVADVVKGKEN